MQKAVILMKIREVSAENLIRFAKIDDADEESEVIEAIIEAGRKFVLSQTGLELEETDDKPDLAVAMLMVCADMYDNRSYETATGKAPSVNLAAQAIINQYCRNIL